MTPHPEQTEFIMLDEPGGRTIYTVDLSVDPDLDTDELVMACGVDSLHAVTREQADRRSLMILGRITSVTLPLWKGGEEPPSAVGMTNPILQPTLLYQHHWAWGFSLLALVLGIPHPAWMWVVIAVLLAAANLLATL